MAGADLKEWQRTLEDGKGEQFGVREGITPFTRQKGKKPVIAAAVASEIVLTGRQISAQEMKTWGIVNKVVCVNEVVDEALRYASLIAENSPDAIICARAGLRQAWETANVEEATNQWFEKHFSLLERATICERV
ncbi:hypothetical protein NW765_013602 [Fusarium oxysporum]|nr:hypothetical protein FOWG_03232 [Fusarium oxysporum f. sp. lycopersici MN25]KAJ4159613.1 hypothetical protein NW765_013602 [Fusarium oxysporum]